MFGVPFPFLPHEQDDGPPPPPKTAVMPVPEKVRFEITWPNVVRVAHVHRPRLSLNIDRLDPLDLDARRTARIAELAEVIDGVPDVTRVSDIDLDALATGVSHAAHRFRDGPRPLRSDAARMARRKGQSCWRSSSASLSS